MSKYLILGIEDISYFSKKSHNQVSGTKLYLQELDCDLPNLRGVRVSEVYIRGDFILPSLDLGDYISIYYDKFGNPCTVTQLSI